MLWGLERRERRVQVFEASHTVTLEARPPAVVQADGEGIGETPVTISLVRQALRVIVPSRPAEPRTLADAVIERMRGPAGAR